MKPKTNNKFKFVCFLEECCFIYIIAVNNLSPLLPFDECIYIYYFNDFVLYSSKWVYLSKCSTSSHSFFLVVKKRLSGSKIKYACSILIWDYVDRIIIGEWRNAILILLYKLWTLIWTWKKVNTSWIGAHLFKRSCIV